MTTQKFITLEEVLGQDAADLTALKKGGFTTEKIGVIPYTAISHEEYKAAKKDCIKMAADGTGRMVPEVDDDRLMLRIIEAAVEKDDRSNFTFLDAKLLKKLGIVTADQAVTKLLKAGEIVDFAVEIQGLSGFGKRAYEEKVKQVKNS